MSSSSPPRQLTSQGSFTKASEPKETIITRLIIAPITFVSFLLSLAFIDLRNSSLRVRVHSPSHAAAGHSLKDTLHRWVYRPRQEPYAYVRSPYGEKTSVRVAEVEEPWHWNTKQKKMLRMEVVDAFEIRTTVVLLMLLIMGLVGFGLGWVFWSGLTVWTG